MGDNGVWQVIISSFKCNYIYDPKQIYVQNKTHVDISGHMLDNNQVYVHSVYLLFSDDCDLMTPYGDIDLGRHWLRQWLGAWRHQAITWTNVELSPKVFCGIHLRSISKQMLMKSIRNIYWEITLLKSLTHHPESNELSTVYPKNYSHGLRIVFCCVLVGLQTEFLPIPWNGKVIICLVTGSTWGGRGDHLKIQPVYTK